MRLGTACAFTVVELLVVVTIIVVLLALIAPALDRAVYQAELTTCAARLRAVGSGAQIYTVDFNRHYPLRSAVQVVSQPFQWRPNELADGLGNDDRPVIRGYIELKLLLDPLAPKGLSLDPADTDDLSEVWSNYRTQWSATTTLK